MKGENQKEKINNLECWLKKNNYLREFKSYFIFNFNNFSFIKITFAITPIIKENTTDYHNKYSKQN
jgi:hypothetical protein